METKHTPGPWSWWTSNGLKRLTAWKMRDGGVLHAVRLRDGFADVEVSEADARLIAAAPELLEALNGYREAFDALFAHCLSNGVFNAWNQRLNCTALNNMQYEAARVIAKATGASP